jgi:hypothetical protein
MNPPRVAVIAFLCGCTVVASPRSTRAADPTPDATDRPAGAAPLAGNVPDAKKLLNAARAEVNRLRGTINRKKQQFETAMNGRAEYREAVAARNKAKAAYEAARRPAVLAARATDAHRAAREKLAAANRDLAAARQAVRVGAADAMKPLADAVREAQAAVAAIENDAASADPAAAQACAALDAADDNVAALYAQHVTRALQTDPACAAARLSLASAESRLDAAGAELKRLQVAAAEEPDEPQLPLAYGDAMPVSAGYRGAPHVLPLRGSNGTWVRSAGPLGSRPLCIGGA